MDIQSQIDNGLLTVTINRPERKNSFTNAMYTAIGDAFLAAETNPAVKAILLKGHEGCFSAGNDLGDFLNNPPTTLQAPVFRFLRAIAAFSKPIVAQVQGVAVGIGTTMLLHCDFVYASSTAKFSMPFVKLGLCPEAASSLLFPRLSGYQKATEWLLLGDMFSAQKASEAGIVSDVMAPELLEAHVQAQLKKILDLPLSGLITTKRLMKSHTQGAVENIMSIEGETFMGMIPQPPAQEAFTAFAEKRAPNFKQFEQQ